MKARLKYFVKTAVFHIVNNYRAQRVARRLTRSKTAFIAYHGITSDNDNFRSWTFVSKTIFRKHMDFLKKEFECLTIDKALKRNDCQSRLPGAVVTFDDGYANNLEIALSILEKFEIPAIIYITTQNVLERRLFWPDIIAMAARLSGVQYIDLRGISKSLRNYQISKYPGSFERSVLEILEDIKRTRPEQREKIVEAIVSMFKSSPGAKKFDIEVENNLFTPLTAEQISVLSRHPLITIGAHSHCHNLLDQIPLAQAVDSIRKSKELLEQMTDQKVDHFAYPNGNTNTDLARVVKQIGFKSAVTYKAGFFKKDEDPYFVKRFGVSANVSMDLFKAMLTGIFVLARKYHAVGLNKTHSHK